MVIAETAWRRASSGGATPTGILRIDHDVSVEQLLGFAAGDKRQHDVTVGPVEILIIDSAALPEPD